MVKKAVQKTEVAVASQKVVEEIKKPVGKKPVGKKVEEKVVEPVTKTEDTGSDNSVEEKNVGDTLINELTDKISFVQLEMKSIQQTLKLLVKEYEKQNNTNNK